MRPACLVFAKAPVPGCVKTRLVPPLSPAAAAGLAAAALRDTVARCREAGPWARLEVHVGGGPDAPEAVAALVPGVLCVPQAEGDLGARLAAAFARTFAGGADPVVVVGSDHPTLPASHLRQAVAALASYDLVLGPSADGGYYAVGLRAWAAPRAPALFEGIPWSSPRTLEETRARAAELGLATSLLSAWYDVDDPETLGRALADAAPDSALRAWAREVGWPSARASAGPSPR
jgi:rSAM/selenodomain-associated transferase 1